MANAIAKMKACQRIFEGLYDQRIIDIFVDHNVGLMDFVSGHFRETEPIYVCLAENLHVDSRNKKILNELYNILIFNKRSIRDFIALGQEKKNLPLIKRKLPRLNILKYVSSAESSYHRSFSWNSLANLKDVNFKNQIKLPKQLKISTKRITENRKPENLEHALEYDNRIPKERHLEFTKHVPSKNSKIESLSLTYPFEIYKRHSEKPEKLNTFPPYKYDKYKQNIGGNFIHSIGDLKRYADNKDFNPIDEMNRNFPYKNDNDLNKNHDKNFITQFPTEIASKNNELNLPIHNKYGEYKQNEDDGFMHNTGDPEKYDVSKISNPTDEMNRTFPYKNDNDLNKNHDKNFITQLPTDIDTKNNELNLPVNNKYGEYKQNMNDDLMHNTGDPKKYDVSKTFNPNDEINRKPPYNDDLIQNEIKTFHPQLTTVKGFNDHEKYPGYDKFNTVSENLKQLTNQIDPNSKHKNFGGVDDNATESPLKPIENGDLNSKFDISKGFPKQNDKNIDIKNGNFEDKYKHFPQNEKVKFIDKTSKITPGNYGENENDNSEFENLDQTPKNLEKYQKDNKFYSPNQPLSHVPRNYGEYNENLKLGFNSKNLNDEENFHKNYQTKLDYIKQYQSINCDKYIDELNSPIVKVYLSKTHLKYNIDPNRIIKSKNPLIIRSNKEIDLSNQVISESKLLIEKCRKLIDKSKTLSEQRVY